MKTKLGVGGGGGEKENDSNKSCSLMGGSCVFLEFMPQLNLSPENIVTVVMH